MDLSDAYAQGVHRQSLPRVKGNIGILLTDRALSGREAAATGWGQRVIAVSPGSAFSFCNRYAGYDFRAVQSRGVDTCHHWR
ncbi:MAG: hypothetical protein RLZZ436_2743 [Planctomycetota bacterium]